MKNNPQVDTRTLSLFSVEEISGPSVEDLTESATLAIRRVIESGSAIVIAYSGGKDSSVVANLVLSAAKDCAALGLKPFIVVTTGDTLVENPEISEHYVKEHRKMKLFAKANGFLLKTVVAQPSLPSTFQMKILTGRGVPSFAGTSTDCTQDLKISAQRSARKKLFKALEGRGHQDPVTMVGTRFAESERRSMKMKARGERFDKPILNKDNELVLSPIAMWTDDDVWEYIGLVSAGIIEGFSDMEEVKRIYAHSAGTSCVVVADSIYEGGAKRKKGGCGTRTGCYICQQSTDKSLENMVQYDPVYAYAKPLLKINHFLRNTRYDWSRRHWVGRTIKNGFIAIEPDTYHPDTLRLLRRAFLTADYVERERAEQAGEPPKFQILPLEMMIAVDAIQNLNGVSRPFEIWADLRDIENGARYELPEVDLIEPQEMPETKFFYVGGDWEVVNGQSVQGLRSSYLESLLELSSCAPDLRELKSGQVVWDLETERGFSVDAESAVMIFDYERERLVEMHDRWHHTPGGITAGYMWYVQYGVLTLDHAQLASHDEIARRTAWKDMHSLTINYSIDELRAKAVRFSDLPADARKAWASKASTDGAQTDFLAALDSDIEELNSMMV